MQEFIKEKIFEKILINSASQYEWASQFHKKRYLFPKIKKIDPQFYVGIKGMRGIGKTVLLLQLASQTKQSIYFSSDAIYLRPYSLYDIINFLKKKGFKNIFIDEIHTRYNWDNDIKTIYDEHAVRIFFTGSSAIELKKTGADLSRRTILLHLKPVSFREYLNIKHDYNLPQYSFKQIIENKKKLTIKHSTMSDKIYDYMKFGGVLYSGKGFEQAIKNSIEKIITKDLATLRNINIKYENDIYRVLYYIAQSPSFETNYSSISETLGISKTFIIRLISDLRAVGVLNTIYPCKKQGHNVKKEPKIYFTVPLRYHYNSDINKGVLREEFFVNNIDVDCYFKTKRGEKTADFKVNGKTIEVGGVSKKNIQNPDYIAVDGLSYEKNKIPLFLFGLNY